MGLADWDRVMCRLAAYLDPPITLARFLPDPPDSLAHQAWAPRELVYARLNADGFGWFGLEGRPAVFTSTLPIWSDANLAGLGRTLVLDLWLAESGSATPGNPVVPANTPPFSDVVSIALYQLFVNPDPASPSGSSPLLSTCAGTVISRSQHRVKHRPARRKHVLPSR